MRLLSLLSSFITPSSPTLSIHFHSQPFVCQFSLLTFGLSPVNLHVDVEEIVQVEILMEAIEIVQPVSLGSFLLLNYLKG